MSGLGVGLLGGLVGLGGAEFRLPLLIGLFGFAALQAVIVNKAMSLIVVLVAIPSRLLAVPLADVASEWTVVINLLVGSLVGAWIGASWATRMRAATLYRVLAILLVGIAVVFAAEHVGALPRVSLPPIAQAIVGVAAGCGIGVVAAIMGVAGGELLIPTITVLYDVSPKLAGSLSLLVSLPTMLVAMLEHPSFASTDLSSTRAICSGGSTVPAALVRTFEEKLGAPFTIVFGQTECSPVASMTHPSDTIADKAGTIGTPMPHVEVKIVDPATGRTLPPGQIGEYCTRGYHVMQGYFENPEATAAAIDADGWLHTGDLCAMDERGYCTVEGRLKDMIIRGGENIYPRELEELLFRHPAVGEVAVVGLPDERYGEVVAAFVRPVPGGVVDKDELIAYLRGEVAPHKIPRHWFAVDAFPLTGSGKNQKFRLREQCSKGEFDEL